MSFGTNAPAKPERAELNYYHVTTPEAAFTWLGGPTKPAGPGNVWLTKPGGERVLRVPADCVRESNRDETAKRMQADLRASKASLN